MKKSEEIFKKVEELEKTDFVTARFGKNWKENAKKNYNVDQVLDIAHINGRKVVLLEMAIKELLDEC